MKKILMSITTILIILITGIAEAAPPDFNGGVSNEYEYQEIVFVSGEPLVFAGEMKLTETERDDYKTVKYTFKLNPTDSTISGKLDRSVSYKINYAKNNDKGQTVANTELTSYKETITIGKDKYILKDFQFSKSNIIDNQPASDFNSGTIKGRKYYTINGNEGKLTIDISGGDVGYENFWGTTETLMLDLYLFSEREDLRIDDKAKPLTWEGSVKIYATESVSKKLRYAPSEVNLSSFVGGNMKVTEREQFARYDYDLPKISIDEETAVPVPLKQSRNINQVDMNREMVPNIQRLILPKFRDTGGHWAENDINKLFSLDVFSGDNQFFVPNVSMNRIDFIRAMIKACDIRVTEKDKQKTRSTRGVVGKSPFQDIPINDDDYPYVKFAYDKGMVSGIKPGIFGKQDFLNRAQAVHILIKALGFEGKAPTPGYFTVFSDDYRIPFWAKDSIYAAYEIGLIQGDSYNRVNADQAMTRAEAAVLLVRFLDFLQDDLQKDYREKIILYN